MKAEGFKCTHDRVLIEPYYKTQTTSGIILSPTNEFPEAGHILSVGPKVNDMQVGDYVYYGIPRSHPIPFEDFDVDGLLLIPSVDVLGILEPLPEGEREANKGANKDIQLPPPPDDGGNSSLMNAIVSK